MTKKEFKDLKIGDIVVCNTQGVYSKTRPEVECEVVDIDENFKFLKVRIAQSGNIYYGEKYPVEYKYFDVVRHFVEIDQEELFALLK